MDFATPADYRIKVKESEKRDKYLDLAWELRKLWNMMMTVIRFVIGALGTVLKILERSLEVLEIEGQIQTVQILALFRSATL